MPQLTINEIVGDLPYGLKCILNRKDIVTLHGLEIEEENNGYFINGFSMTVLIDENDHDSFVPASAHQTTPILTRVEDMSEEQLKELQCLWYGSARDIYETTFDEIKFGINDPRKRISHGTGVQYSTFKDGKHVQTGTLSLERLNIFQFNYLHLQHIDLYDLIDRGLAIDAKTLK